MTDGSKDKMPIDNTIIMSYPKGKQGGDTMPTNEKEYNGYLFDQLSLLEEIEEVATETNAEEVLKTVAKLKKRVERKLYQNP
jgi:hypothetical protein